MQDSQNIFGQIPAKTLNSSYPLETTSFTVDRKKFHTELLTIKKLTPKYFKSGVVQINVLPEQIELHTTGITKYIDARTEGYFDVFVPIRLLYAYSSTVLTDELTFEVRQGEIHCGGAIFSSPEIKVRPIFNANNEVLTMNSTEFALLKYSSRANETELADFGLTELVQRAEERLKTRLTEATEILSYYQVTYKELEKLVLKKINK